jgi:membrane-bound lytic murein transglycosylase D
MMHSFSLTVCSLALCTVLLFPGTDVRSEESSSGPSVFSIPHGMEKSVEFWKRIFTLYSTTQFVFFDPFEPTNIYSVLEIDNERNSRRRIQAETTKLIAAHHVTKDRVRVQRGIKERFAEGLARSGRYMEQMRQIFRQEGLPVELTYLPLVESSFNINARSTAGAVGMWQFIRSTGKRFLRVDRHLDERKDPLDSTRAAALLLKENYQLLGSWPLAVTAYNHGPEGVNRAIARVGSRDLVDLIQRYQSRTWGFASKNFYAEFLAAVEVAKNAQQYFPGLEYHPFLPVQEVQLDKPTPISGVLKSAGIAQREFFELNPALSSKLSTVPRGYRVKIPAKPEVIPATLESTPRPEPPVDLPRETAEPTLLQHQEVKN